MKTAVVTGANGFLGKALVKELCSREINVIAIVHTLSDNDVSITSGVRYIPCDLKHYVNLCDDLSAYEPDVFYHLAWEGTSGPKRADEKIQLSNVQGACDAARLASRIGCRRFVFASSIMEYEVDKAAKLMQDPGISAIYSTAKQTADYMSRIIAADNKIEFISGLISNIYGPGEKSPRLINSSIRKLLKGERLSLSPCEQMYDFIYIDDAARIFCEIGEKGKSGRIYYVGNRRVYPLKKFMEELRDVVAPDAVLGFGDIPFTGSGLTYNEFDKELLYNDTGFIPGVSFKKGVELTRDWIKAEGEYE